MINRMTKARDKPRKEVASKLKVRKAVKEKKPVFKRQEG